MPITIHRILIQAHVITENAIVTIGFYKKKKRPWEVKTNLLRTILKVFPVNFPVNKL